MYKCHCIYPTQRTHLGFSGLEHAVIEATIVVKAPYEARTTTQSVV